MSPITIIEGDDLDYLIRLLTTRDGRPGWEPYRLRIHQDEGRVKIKVNEGTWTYWIGKDDS